MSEKLNQLYINTTMAYHEFYEKVHRAFSSHCDEIKNRTNEKLEHVAEDDQDGMQRILDEEEKELNEAYKELENILNSKDKEERAKLEEIAKRQETEEFNIEKELSKI